MPEAFGGVLMNVTSRQSNMAIMAIVLCIWPHALYLPLSLTVFISLVLIYALCISRRLIPKPIFIVNLMLNILGGALVFFAYKSVLINPFYIALLITFVSLKTIEIRGLRDLYIIAFCAFYLIFSVLILVQELWVIPYMLIALLATFSLLLEITSKGSSLSDIGKTGFKAIFLALPIAFVLFYLFPRFSNPLWHLPGAKTAASGFNEWMRPGDIESLFFSQKRVMRITFNKNYQPAPYWQGLILEQFDGQTWSAKPTISTFWQVLPLIENQTKKSDYEILLEAHGRSWLFYQHHVQYASPKLQYQPNIGLKVWRMDELNQRFFYSIIVNKNKPLIISIQEARDNTTLPKDYNPKLLAFGKALWIKSGQNPDVFKQLIASYIYNQDYFYSLDAPKLNDSKAMMDEFWFNTKTGYCEHYASAVAIIFRAAQIPSRVVLGYYGGSFNPVGQYLEIKEQDAHAWVEFYDVKRGWQVFDATKFIHPDRIDKQIKMLQDEKTGSREWFNSNDWQGTLSYVNQLLINIESMRYFLDKWLLFYNHESQASFLSALGLKDIRAAKLLALSILTLVGFIIAVFIIWQLINHFKKAPHLRAWEQLKKAAKTQGIDIHPWDSLPSVIEKLKKYKPNHEIPLDLERKRYEYIRYRQNSHENNAIKKLIKRVLKLCY